MNLIIIQCSANADGLTAACARAAAEGARLAGSNVEEVALNDCRVGMCQACERGWGTCLKEHQCQVQDGFQDLHRRILAADALILATPVYWGEMSESAKALTDRLRRCEATRDRQQGGSTLFGRPYIAIAAAGGSGNGLVTCLGSMERWGQHVGVRVVDLIPVNRWTRAEKMTLISGSVRRMVEAHGEELAK